MKKRMAFFLTMLTIVCATMVNPSSSMADWVMAPEHTHHWARGTAITLSAIYTADLNDDGLIEIVSIGTTEESGIYHAELRVANWDGSTYTLRAIERWMIDGAATNGREVYCGDLNGDGTSEILTAAISDQLELKLWRFDAGSGSLTVEAEGTWETSDLRSMAVGDIDEDGLIEIVTGERRSVPNRFQIRIVQFDGSDFVDEHIENWQVDGAGGSVHGLAVGDVDADGETEIVTAVTANNQIQVRIGYWNGSDMNLETSDQWYTLDRSNAMQVSLGNLDDDSFLEIAVAGTARNVSDFSHPLFGCISVWQWDQTELRIEAHNTWQSTSGNVEFFGCYVTDINSDDLDEIIVAGPLHEDPAMNILRIYNLDGLILNTMFSEEWLTEEMQNCFTYTVHAANVDRDRHIEIITGGRAVNSSGENNHEMTIWSVWFQIRAPGWLSWLENILGFEGWPLYLRARDLIPMPWPIVIYTMLFLGLVAVVVWGITRLVTFIRKPQSRTSPRR